MSQLVYLNLKETTLVELSIQLMLPQQPQHYIEMLDMLFLIFRIYKYIIDEHNNKLIQIWMQHTFIKHMNVVGALVKQNGMKTNS